MPNHVHVLLLRKVALCQLTQWIKGTTAKEPNLLPGRTEEPFWRQESYDHWARNEREFHRIVAYVENNPVMTVCWIPTANAARPTRWRWSFGRRITRQHKDRLQTALEDLHLGQQVLRAFYSTAF